MSQHPSTDPGAVRPMNESKGRVLPFRGRNAQPGRSAPPAPPDLGRFERRQEEPDDFRHRMTMNALALVATAGLIAVGIWIADVMAHMRKDQDCVLTGRTKCAPVNAPPQAR